MKSCMHMVGSIVWLLTAVGCIHLGLVAFGYDLLTMMSMSQWAHYCGILFGVAGVASLILFFMGGGGCGCGCANTPHNNHH